MSTLSPAQKFWTRPSRQRRLADLDALWQQGNVSPSETAGALADRIRAHPELAARVFIDPGLARLDAAASTTTRNEGALADIPVSLKDLFDTRGTTTRAGSRVLEHSPPAQRDAPAVARLKQTDAVAFGRTTMTEFAFSGLGINPHFGTPPNPFDERLIPGGSSSGGAASVAFGMAAAALGSDTSGSLRIPAAFCGLTGFKPSQASVPREGAWPLSPSLDCIGPMAPSVACCARLWAVLAARDVPPLDASPRPLRLAMPAGALLKGLDADVNDAFEQACGVLTKSGCHLERLPIQAIEQTITINGRGGLVLPEAAALHRPWLDNHRDRLDPMVAQRMSAGLNVMAGDYLERLWRRESLQRQFARELIGFDAVLLPTTPLLPPRQESLERDGQGFIDANRRALRNTSVFNYLDGAALSLPWWPPGARLPIGIMLATPQGTDVRALQTAAVLEGLLARNRSLRGVIA